MRIVTYLLDVLRNRLGYRVQPRFLTYTVTFGCNARCVMCDSWKMPSPNDLTLTEIETIFSQLPLMDAVRLTGGEPFVRRDLAAIDGLVQKHLRPYVIHVTTNGFLTSRIVDYCRQRSRRVPLQMLVSIDGVGEKHNTIRGHAGAWDQCLETIAALAPLQHELNLKVMVNQTIVDAEGVAHYKLLREALAGFGVQNNVVIAYDNSATYNTEKNVDLAPRAAGEFDTFGDLTREQIAELVTEIECDLASRPFFERIAKRYYLRGIANRLLGGRGAPNPRCISLGSHLRLFPNGDVPTCQFNSRIVGNLRQQSFAEIWNSAFIQEQRQWVRACPGCWAECEVLPSAIYTGDLLLHTISTRGNASTRMARTAGAHSQGLADRASGSL